MSSRRAADTHKSKSSDHGSVSPVQHQAETSSSKASSPTESVDFRFLTLAHPKDTKNAKFRQTVRSHVTSRQHQNQRRALEQANRAESTSAAGQSSSAVSSGTSEAETSSPEASSSSPSPSVERAATPLVRLNPVDLYPGEWHPHLRPVMDHYLDHMCIDDASTSPSTRNFLRSNYLAVVFSDPAPLHALLLVAAAHMTKLQGSTAHGINLLQLKGMAIREINRALLDHQTSGSRAMSDPLAIAVSKMATFELCFGQRDTFHTHMMGLLRIVTLRGGLQSLGLNGAIERSLLWIDVNASIILDRPLYFPPAAFASTVGHPQPDKRLFLVGI